MISPGEPDFAFSQVIGTGFHQDAFHEWETLEQSIDRYRNWPPLRIREASQTGHRLLGEGLDEEEMERILREHGFWLLPEPLGFAGYNAFLEHLVGRLDSFIAGLPPEAFVEPEILPQREFSTVEREALSSLLRGGFSSPGDDPYAAVVSRWAAGRSPEELRAARSAAKALIDGPLPDEPMTAALEGLGLGYDLWEHDREGVAGFLEALADELAVLLGEPREYDEEDD
jgi:hypothetical protein